MKTKDMSRFMDIIQRQDMAILLTHLNRKKAEEKLHYRPIMVLDHRTEAVIEF